MTESLTVSVVIPTRRRLASLMSTLEALRRQDYPAHLIEVVVVADGDAGTVEALRGRGDLRVLDQAHGGPAAARNRGVEHARGELVLFVDDDVVPAPWCVRRHVEAHASRTDLAVIGPLLPPRSGTWDSPWVRWEAQTLRRQYSDMEVGRWSVTARQFYTGNASVRREHLVRAGGFDASLRRGEDVELAYRLRDLGVGFGFHPDASAHHEPSRTYGSWLWAAREYGRMDALLATGTRPEVLRWAACEFHQRHAVTRRLVLHCLRHSRTASVMPWLVAPLARAAVRCGLGSLSDQLCGGVFNALYWQGVKDQLGGGPATVSLIASRGGSLHPSALPDPQGG